MNYFNQEVMAVLNYVGVNLSPDELHAYIKVCKQAEGQPNKQYKTKKDPHMGRRFSVFHTPLSDHDSRLTHWLVLAGRDNWETKNKNTVSKLFVNILTGEKKFVKIRRPETIYAGTHIVDSLVEAENNKLMQVPTQHYTRYTATKGTKTYLFQPYRGDENLLDFIKKPSSNPQKIINMLLASGEILANLHQRGYLHTDFKPQNVVISQNKNMLSLVDVEFMMTILEGQQGKQCFRGTKRYQHPGWFSESQSHHARGEPINYSTKNDIYSFLVMAEGFLAVAFTREPEHDYRKRIQEVWIKMTKWQKEPFNALPTLSTIMAELNDLTITDPAILADKKIKKSCFRF